MCRGKISQIYEINTRVWLEELSSKYQKGIKLDSVPEEEIIDFKKIGFDAIWLMGVWLPSKKSRKLVFRNQQLLNEFRAIFPDITPEDISSSPYSIAGYEVDSYLGGNNGLLDFKERLNKHGIKLILDFVPNHVALDHPWIKTKPKFFINGTKAQIRKNPEIFFTFDNYDTILAYGKDPYFPSWKDVAQLNYFNPQTRKAMCDVLQDIAPFCDGVRCDMAMLILKRIQKQIWGKNVFGGNKFKEPQSEFWQEAIMQVKKKFPDFIFIAEVYWGLESELVFLGFDYAYDKLFYDALKEMRLGDIKAYVSEKGDLRDKRLRFIENHDEGRAASAFGDEASKAAALILALSPGTHLFHQGQLEGLRLKLPIWLIKRIPEETNPSIQSFYKNLLTNLKTINQNNSQWVLLNCLPAWVGNPTSNNFLAFFNRHHYLAVINYSVSQSQCYVPLNLTDIQSKKLMFKDLLGPAEYVRSSEDVASRGLYLDLPAYGFHLFRITGVSYNR